MIGHPILFFYLFRQHLKLAVLVLSGLFLIVFLGQFSELARYQSELQGWSAARTFEMSLYRTPTLMQAILPHVILISSALTVARAGRRLEIAVMMQNGLSPARLLWPLALAAMLLGATFTAALNPLASKAFAYSEDVLKGVAGRVSDPSHRDPRQMVLRLPDGAIYLLIDHVPPEATEIYGLTVYRLDDTNTLLQSLEAGRAVGTGDGDWQLRDVHELYRAKGLPDAAAIGDTLHFSPEALGDRYDDEQAVSVYALPQKIRLARAVGAPSAGLEVRLGWLLALPLLLGAITWLAGSIVVRPLYRDAWKGDAALVLAAAFVIYTVSTVLDALGVRGIVPVWVATGALPAGCFAAGSLMLAMKRGGNRRFRRRFGRRRGRPGGGGALAAAGGAG